MNIDINIIGDEIRLISTVLTDVDKVIEFEQLNKQYVNHYTKDKHVALLNDDDCLHLSIRRLEDDRLIGHILLFGLCNPDLSLEFRRIVVNEKGFGYGRASIKLLKQLCFDKLKFHRFWLDVYDDNERAISLYESEGFVKEGILRDTVKTENGYRSLRIYSILEKEYMEAS